jgi:hypothetical protein
MEKTQKKPSKVMAFADLSDARLLKRAELEVATAAGEEA